MYIKKHLLLCATPSKQKCFKGNEGLKTWECLKVKLKDIESNKEGNQGIILRSKVDCLRVCKNGPILLIWPDGIWYEHVSEERILKIIDSHIMNDNPIYEWIFKKTPFL